MRSRVFPRACINLPEDITLQGRRPPILKPFHFITHGGGLLATVEAWLPDMARQ